MEIALVRVDGRLIHGQVAVAWARLTGADHILVVNDETASDPMQRMLAELATPPGTKLEVTTVEGAISILNQPDNVRGRYMIIFKRPQDLLPLARKGIIFPAINIGGMYHQPGKKQIDKALFIDDDDVRTIKELMERGAWLYYQVAPMTPREDLRSKLGLATE